MAFRPLTLVGGRIAELPTDAACACSPGLVQPVQVVPDQWTSVDFSPVDGVASIEWRVVASGVDLTVKAVPGLEEWRFLAYGINTVPSLEIDVWEVDSQVILLVRHAEADTLPVRIQKRYAPVLLPSIGPVSVFPGQWTDVDAIPADGIDAVQWNITGGSVDLTVRAVQGPSGWAFTPFAILGIDSLEAAAWSRDGEVVLSLFHQSASTVEVPLRRDIV